MPSSAHLIALAVAAESGEAPDELVADLSALLAEWTFQAKGTDPDRRLTVSSVPGYLTTSENGRTVFVPWSLSFAFPGPGLLSQLMAVADRSSLDGDSCLTLSGSTTFSGILASLGDIDLSQYLFVRPERIPSIIRNIVNAHTSAILVSVEYVTKYFEPWAFLDALESDPPKVLPDHRIKLDLMDDQTPFGLMPVSNVVLPADRSDHNSGAAKKSFLFQEVMILKDGVPPWGLHMPDEVLRYMLFLCGEVTKYRNDHPIKGLKRALCLTRLIAAHDLAAQVEVLLTQEKPMFAAAESCIKDLESLWPHLPGSARIRLEPLLAEKKRSLAKMKGSDAVGPDPRVQLLDEVLSRMRDLVLQAGGETHKWGLGETDGAE